MKLNTMMRCSRWSLPLLLSVSLAACQSGKETVPAPQTVPEVAEVETVPQETVQEPAYTAPLTGLAAEEPDASRPIAVMINNAPAARPQSGLAQADMVYEVLAEGGITRLIAIYQSYHGDVTIGPVRSIRPYLITIGETLNSLLVHAGGSPEAYSMLQNGGKEHLDEITNAGAPFWRDSSRKAPHNLYTNEENLRKTAADKNYQDRVTIPQFPFMSPVEPSSGQTATGTSSADSDSSVSTDSLSSGNNEADTAKTDTDSSLSAASLSEHNQGSDNNKVSSVSSSASHSAAASNAPEVSSSSEQPSGSEETADQIELKFLLDSYKVGYLYDADSGLYKRQMNRQDHVDLNTGDTLTAANVIVLGGDYKVLDDVGRLSLNLDSGGKAILFQQGKMIRGEWSRKAGDVIRFYHEGTESLLVAGVTYYNIVPNTTSFYSHLTIDGEKMDDNG